MISFSKNNFIISSLFFFIIFIFIISYTYQDKKFPISNYYKSLEFQGVVIDKYEEPKLHNCFIISIMENDSNIVEFDLPFICIDLFTYCNIGDSISKQPKSDSVTIIRNGSIKVYCLEFIRNK